MRTTDEKKLNRINELYEIGVKQIESCAYEIKRVSFQRQLTLLYKRACVSLYSTDISLFTMFVHSLDSVIPPKKPFCIEPEYTSLIDEMKKASLSSSCFEKWQIKQLNYVNEHEEEILQQLEGNESRFFIENCSKIHTRLKELEELAVWDNEYKNTLDILKRLEKAMENQHSRLDLLLREQPEVKAAPLDENEKTTQVVQSRKRKGYEEDPTESYLQTIEQLNPFDDTSELLPPSAPLEFDGDASKEIAEPSFTYRR